MNWRDLDTSEGESVAMLNRAIGERLGYEARPTLDGSDEWAIFDPDGNRTWPGVSYDDIEDEEADEKYDHAKFCWISAYDADYRIDHQRWEAPPIPDWAQDLNAAASLPQGLTLMQVWRYSDGFTIADIKSATAGNGHGSGKTEALARCYAWLDWKDAQLALEVK